MSMQWSENIQDDGAVLEFLVYSSLWLSLSYLITRSKPDCLASSHFGVLAASVHMFYLFWRAEGEAVFLKLNFEPAYNINEREWFSSCPERVQVVAAIYVLCGLGQCLNFLHCFLSFKRVILPP